MMKNRIHFIQIQILKGQFANSDSDLNFYMCVTPKRTFKKLQFLCKPVTEFMHGSESAKHKHGYVSSKKLAHQFSKTKEFSPACYPPNRTNCY